MTTPASTSTITGSCYCGATAYKVVDVPAGPVDGIICHCKTCQKLHTFQSYNASFPKDTLSVTKGNPSMYKDVTTDSGKPIYRYLCGQCGSALYSYPDLVPDVVFVKVGSLDVTERVVPAAEIYFERAIQGTAATSADRKTKLYKGMMAEEI